MARRGEKLRQEGAQLDESRFWVEAAEAARPPADQLRRAGSASCGNLGGARILRAPPAINSNDARLGHAGGPARRRAFCYRALRSWSLPSSPPCLPSARRLPAPSLAGPGFLSQTSRSSPRLG